MLGCSGENASTALASYLGRAETTAVLVIDPGEGLACNNAVSDWMLWAKSGSGRSLAVFFTHRPTKREQAVLRVFRLHPDTVMGTFSGKRFEQPRVYVAVGGEIVDTAIGRTAMTELAESYQQDVP